MKIYIIAAVDRKFAIGKNNSIPWNIPSDKQHFKKLTLNHPIIMGRKTFESIGKVLPERKNIILTKDKNFSVAGGFVAHSVEEALKLCENGEAFVIGGEKVYHEFLPITEKIFLTKIDADFNGDKFFPQISDDEWAIVEKKPFYDAFSKLNIEFITYRRK